MFGPDDGQFEGEIDELNSTRKTVLATFPNIHRVCIFVTDILRFPHEILFKVTYIRSLYFQTDMSFLFKIDE
jgi:hypothetical protein